MKSKYEFATELIRRWVHSCLQSVFPKLVSSLFCSSSERNKREGGRVLEVPYRKPGWVVDCSSPRVHRQYLNGCCVFMFGSTQTGSKASWKGLVVFSNCSQRSQIHHLSSFPPPAPWGVSDLESIIYNTHHYGAEWDSAGCSAVVLNSSLAEKCTRAPALKISSD